MPKEESRVLVEIEGYKYTDGSQKVFGFSDTGVTVSVGSAGSDSFYPGLIVNGVLFEHGINDIDDAISIQLINNGALDHLRNYAFTGFEIKVYLSDNRLNDGKYYLAFVGVVESLLVQYSKVNIKSRSHFKVMDTLVNPEVFSGVVGDLEGGLGLEGRAKPRLFGSVFNIQPTPVDPANLVYGISWDNTGKRERINQITEVRDGGAPYTLVGDFGSSLLLMGATVKAGEYATCLAEGLIKLGAVPTYDVTVDAENSHNNTYETFIAQVVAETSIPAYHVDNPVPHYVLGHYVTGKEKYIDVDKKLREGLDIYQWFDASGAIIISALDRHATPTVEFVDPDVPLADNQIPMFRREMTGREKPPKNLEIGYRRNYHTQTGGDLAGSVIAQGDKTRFGDEYLYLTQKLVFPQDLYPTSDDLVIDTSIANATGASAVKQNQVSINRVVQDIFEVEVPILYKVGRLIVGITPFFSTGVPAVAGVCVKFDSSKKFDLSTILFDKGTGGCIIQGDSTLNIGDTVNVTSSRFGLKKTPMLINKIRIKTKAMTISYTLKGVRT